MNFIFDLGGVIVSHDNQRLVTELSNLCPNPIVAVPEIVRLICTHDTSRGDVTIPELHKMMVEKLEMNKNYSTFLEAWNCHFGREPGMENLINKLSKKYSLYILSNTNFEHWRHITKHYPEMHYFKKAFLSYEMRQAKPDIEIYKTVVKELQCSAKNCFFTDDVKVNVDKACEAGLDAVQFTGYENFNYEIKLRNLY